MEKDHECSIKNRLISNQSSAMALSMQMTSIKEMLADIRLKQEKTDKKVLSL